jgi:hypothetical protein
MKCKNGHSHWTDCGTDCVQTKTKVNKMTNEMKQKGLKNLKEVLAQKLNTVTTQGLLLYDGEEGIGTVIGWSSKGNEYIRAYNARKNKDTQQLETLQFKTTLTENWNGEDWLAFEAKCVKYLAF